MDGNYKPVLTEYGDFPVLAAALLSRGLSDEEAAGVLGGNFLRLWTSVRGSP
jgi:microsomal dipeptidase-like Zn-dependent dipeptidase